MKVLVIDNYDSFTYNLVQYLQELGATTLVYRNDAVTLPGLRTMRFDRIVISPGPGGPVDAGISCDIIRQYHAAKPILGVCLGNQCIGFVFGGSIVRAPTIMHGKTSLIHHCGTGIFKGVKNPFSATRYHSLIVQKKTLPKQLTVTARTADGIIMGLEMKGYPLWGVQFHPESILTEEGKKILKNFLTIPYTQ